MPKSAAHSHGAAKNGLGLKFEGKSRSGLRIPIPAGAVQMETKLPELKYINAPRMKRESSAVGTSKSHTLQRMRNS